jgi:adenine phosphoribosyltransferase
MLPAPQDPVSAPASEVERRLAETIRSIADHPVPGVTFRDITTLLSDAGAFRSAVDAMTAAHAGDRIDLVVGVESRGFVLGAPIAYLLGAGFVPVRKQGRLPAATISTAYALEYGEAVLEVHTDAITRGQRVLIVDDLLATGGTAAATIRLVEQLGGVVAALAFLVELVGLRGAEGLGGHRHTSIITF